ncbi:MAG: hypothetical protein SCK70_11520, partial [bacterium]|nr:hypothetical protein [bacterium]
MKNLKKMSMNFLMVLTLSIFMFVCQKSADEFYQGLVGAYFGDPDLTGIKDFALLENLDQRWGEANGFSMEWSGKWEGFVIAPVSDKVVFHVATNKQTILKVGDIEINVKGDAGEGILPLDMKKGERYPIELSYLHEIDGEGFFSVQWNWDDGEKSPIPPEYLFHTNKQADNWNWLIDPDPKAIDRRLFASVPAKHVIVADEPGYFFGWPANHGVWQWGDEILV